MFFLICLLSSGGRKAAARMEFDDDLDFDMIDQLVEAHQKQKVGIFVCAAFICKQNLPVFFTGKLDHSVPVSLLQPSQPSSPLHRPGNPSIEWNLPNGASVNVPRATTSHATANQPPPPASRAQTNGAHPPKQQLPPLAPGPRMGYISREAARRLEEQAAEGVGAVTRTLPKKALDPPSAGAAGPRAEAAQQLQLLLQERAALQHKLGGLEGTNKLLQSNLEQAERDRQQLRCACK